MSANKSDSSKVIRLDVTANVCERHEKTWDDVLKELNSAQVQVIFASAKCYLDASPRLREEMESQLRIPPALFDRMYVQSNGFAGHNLWLDDNNEVKCYTFWSRFTIKQTYDELRPKRTFTPHVSNHREKSSELNAEISVHGPQSMQHGWEWYEMGFFTSWDPSGHVTLMCFNVPAVSQSTIYTTLCSQAVDPSLPYSSFTHILDELLRLYDNSVWSVRNHISRWEARRTQETDYALLHEIARHGVHVNETLNVATRSLSSIRQHHGRSRVEIDLVSSKNKRRHWDAVGEHLEFQLRFLEGLAERSQANNARIQNEITLAFNTAAQRDSRIQVRMGEQATNEASAMRAIAVVTMTFLPATFVSTLFGMNFFSFEPSGDGGRSSFIVSRHFWVYWALSVPMTIVTLVVWFWWNRWARLLFISQPRTNGV